MKIIECIGEKQAERIGGPNGKYALTGLIVRPEEEPEVAEIRVEDIRDAIGVPNYAVMGACGFEDDSCVYYRGHSNDLPTVLRAALQNGKKALLPEYEACALLGLKKIFHEDGRQSHVKIVSLTQEQLDRYRGLFSRS